MCTLLYKAKVVEQKYLSPITVILVFLGWTDVCLIRLYFWESNILVITAWLLSHYCVIFTKQRLPSLSGRLETSKKQLSARSFDQLLSMTSWQIRIVIISSCKPTPCYEWAGLYFLLVSSFLLLKRRETLGTKLLISNSLISQDDPIKTKLVVIT